MIHGDEKGLKLPPAIAPIQVVIVPIGKSDKVHSKSKEAYYWLLEAGIRVKLDDRTELTPGKKYNE